MIITYTGNYFDYGNITKDSINKEDIIPALTRINRFVGHTFRPYSVGEHTFWCYMMAKRLGYSIREQLLVFIHDFTEAYCGDVNTDLKNLLPEYKRIEREVELAIYEYLGVKPPTEEEEFKIKVVDYTMLVVEMRDITHHDYKQKIKEVKEYISPNMLKEFEVNKRAGFDEKSLIHLLNLILDDLIKKMRKGEYNDVRILRKV